MTKVKFAALSTIALIAKDNRILMTKKELVELRDEINSFINYYQLDFTEPALSNEDILWLDNETWKDA